jgi:hypothetical protein
MQRLSGYSFQTSFTSRPETVPPNEQKDASRSIINQRSVSMVRNFDVYVVNNGFGSSKSLTMDVNTVFFLPSV